MLGAAGGIVSSVSSAEIYANMQTGTLDAAITSSTSLISYRLDELAKNLTTGRGKSFWYMLEPLLMSKSVYDGLSADAKKAITDVGESMQAFGLAEAKKDDEQIAGIYIKAGVKVADMDSAAIDRWRKIAEAEAWTDFAGRNADCARFLKLAQGVSAA